MLNKTGCLRKLALGGSLITMLAALSAGGPVAFAQMPVAMPAGAVRQIGTVKTVAGKNLVLTTAAGQEVSVSLVDGAKVLQLAPGSTNLKDAQAITLSEISVGDRVLVTGRAGADASSLEGSRVILMKSGDIAQKHATEQADWQKRGAGGIVSAVDATSGVLTVTEGAKKVTVNTSNKTEFRRYAGDSVKFEDAEPGTLAQIHSGDQLRVRGAKSSDGSSVDAEEVISGSFKNLAGMIVTISAESNSLTLKDLATKKTVTVRITANSSVRALPPRAAAMFAARAKAGAANGSGPRAGSQGTTQGTGVARASGAGAGGLTSGGADEEERSAGMDLSQLVSRLPEGKMSDLKVGDAVMIVASQSDAGSATETAVTLLSGVEPILAATPSGTQSMTLSPWNVGGAGPEGGAQQ